jgi:glycerophosphoryl diester phosphodiesterase
MSRQNLLAYLSFLFAFVTALPALPSDLPPTLGQVPAAERLQRVAERKKQMHVICHRAASEFAHKNTLEAYRAAFELGADGNEIDIRMTKDGVLVCFHDDMLDQLLFAYGDVSDITWAELQTYRFQIPVDLVINVAFRRCLKSSNSISNMPA